MTKTTFRLLSHDPTFRHLGRIVTFYPTNECEMGDEDGCEHTPAYWLTAHGSYVKPMMLCEHHANEEHVAFGTPIPRKS
jgi:hypothetical protein